MSNMLRGGLIASLCALVFAFAPASRAQSGGVPVVDIDGKGYGHGVGLSQWGAMYMASAGAGHEDILATFYPGTDLGTVDPSDVRVVVYPTPDNRATLRFPTGGQVLSSPSGPQQAGFPVDVGPGGAVVVSYDGSGYHVSPQVVPQAAAQAVPWSAPAPGGNGCVPVVGCPGGSTTTTTLPSTLGPTIPPASSDGDSSPSSQSSGSTSTGAASSAGPLWATAGDGGTVGIDERGRHYRGLLEATASGGTLRVVNELDIDSYLEGMGEVPGSWPPEAVEAQAVIARTYALRAMASGGELCDYDLCQVYEGADQESPGQNAAVEATAGQVLDYRGGLAATVYSADAGGVTANTLEGFGTADDRYPYLTTVHYDTPDPLPWHVEIALSDVAERLGYAGRLQAVTVSNTGPSGRALSVVLHGNHGDSTVDGREFAADLGLRSTLFTPTVGTAATAPPPPPSASALQVLPDNGAALAAAAAQTPVKRSASAGQATRTAAATIAAKRKSSAARAHPFKRANSLASRPATWLALTLLVVLTAAAVSCYGMNERALALPARLLTTALPSIAEPWRGGLCPVWPPARTRGRRDRRGRGGRSRPRSSDGSSHW